MIAITLDNERVVAGETLGGVLTITVTGPEPLALGPSGVTVSLEGHEVISWPNGDNPDAGNFAASRTLADDTSETNVSCRVTPAGVDTLNVGTHELRFSLGIPANLPGSADLPPSMFPSGRGSASIAYTVTATAGSGGSLSRARLPVTLLCSCGAPERPDPVSAEGSSTFYFTSGSLDVGCELPLGGFALAGALCPVKVLLANGTSPQRRVPSVTVSLRRTMRAVASSPREAVREKTESVGVEQKVQLAWNDEKETEVCVPFHIAPGVIPSTCGAEPGAIGVRYHLVVSAQVTLGTDVTVVLPVQVIHRPQWNASPAGAAGVEYSYDFGDGGASASGAASATGAASDAAGAGAGGGNGAIGSAMGGAGAASGADGSTELRNCEPQECTVYFKQGRMFHVDVYALGPGARMQVDVDGVGRSAVTLLVSRDHRPGLVSGGQYEATDLGNYRYTLVAAEATRVPIAPGRYYIGVWGNQLLPKPSSTFVITLRLTGVATSEAEARNLSSSRSVMSSASRTATVDPNALLAGVAAHKAAASASASASPGSGAVASGAAASSPAVKGGGGGVPLRIPALISHWSPEHVAQFLSNEGFSRAAGELLCAAGITGTLLATLDPEDLEGLGIDAKEAEGIAVVVAGRAAAEGNTAGLGEAFGEPGSDNDADDNDDNNGVDDAEDAEAEGGNIAVKAEEIDTAGTNSNTNTNTETNAGDDDDGAKDVNAAAEVEEVVNDVVTQVDEDSAVAEAAAEEAVEEAVAETIAATVGEVVAAEQSEQAIAAADEPKASEEDAE